MEQESRTSIYVAPLHIVKSTLDTESGPDISLSIMQTQHRQQNTSQSTPLDTNHPSPKAISATRPAFHNYLRASYPFRPPADVSLSSITLPLDAGNVILVHSIHTNGWADGTLLDHGARGWLPTNYCEGYDHLSVRPLLKALTDFYEMVRSKHETTLDIFCNQDYMRGLIAGVRFLLEKSECLTRDSAMVRNHDAIRRTRKALLSDLSSLVKMTKSLQDIALGSVATQPVDHLLSQMLPSACKVITRGVKFLDVWLEIRKADVEANRTKEGDTAILGRPRNYKRDSLAAVPHDLSDGREENEPSPRKMSSLNSDGQANARPSSSRQSLSYGRSSPQSGLHRASVRGSSTTFQSKRISVTHRMTSGGYATGPPNFDLASERLKSSHDTFLGCLGTFLGLHMQSRSSSELLLTTQQSVKSCRELLTVIEVVLEHDLGRSRFLVEAKDTMYDNITTLVHAARDIFHPANSTDEDAAFVLEDGRRLIAAARDCVRGAGECVAMTRAVLERIGDFEPEAAELQSSVVTIGSPRSSQHVRSRSQTVSSEVPSTPVTIADAHSIKSPKSRETIASQTNSTKSTTDTLPPLPTADRASSNPAAAEMSFSPPDPSHSPPSQSPFLPNHESQQRREPMAHAARDPTLQAPNQGRGIVNSAGSNSTYRSSGRDSEISTFSIASTRATSPGALSHRFEVDATNGRLGGRRSPGGDDLDETETKILEKTFAHELLYSKSGQIIGGTLPALIEKLTAHHSTPDALFVSTFYLTFRLFASSQNFAEALAYRFEYVGETPAIASPVRLRVYNAFKGWLESHWRHDCDDPALPFIRAFARGTLTEVLPTAGKRLSELADKVADVHGPLVPRLVSSIGKTNTSIAQYINPDTPMPAPIVTKAQLTTLKTWKLGSSDASILDFDPLELARQLTIKASAIFCSILPEELIATEWMKRSSSLAVNVRAMSTLSTDLANLVADSVLQPEEPKKRAILIKQWVKVANKCVELKNYDSLMAIICSLDSSTIARMKKTWDIVSLKTKAILEELKKIVDVSRNHVALRQRLQHHVPPCLPFVGIYLTDLTFVDHGNPSGRQLDTEHGCVVLINYDKHMKTAKIISELQRFQIPYRLTEVPELQTWIQDQLVRVRSAGEKSFQTYYRRSLVLEPRDQLQVGAPSSGMNASVKSNDKTFDFLGWSNGHRDKSIASNG